MKLYLIRHGQTDLNKENRLQGRRGLPLNQMGVNQAKQLAEKLKNVKFNFVFSSPQERAVQTAQIALNVEPVIDCRLDVYDLGEADNLKVDEAKCFYKVIPDPSVYAGVENIVDYKNRILNFVTEIVTKYKSTNYNIAVCGHKCTMGCISAILKGMPEDGDFLKMSIPNGDYSVIEI